MYRFYIFICLQFRRCVVQYSVNDVYDCSKALCLISIPFNCNYKIESTQAEKLREHFSHYKTFSISTFFFLQSLKINYNGDIPLYLFFKISLPFFLQTKK